MQSRISSGQKQSDCADGINNDCRLQFDRMEWLINKTGPSAPSPASILSANRSIAPHQKQTGIFRWRITAICKRYQLCMKISISTLNNKCSNGGWIFHPQDWQDSLLNCSCNERILQIRGVLAMMMNTIHVATTEGPRTGEWRNQEPSTQALISSARNKRL